MLSPQQMPPFLTHPDCDVRYVSALYLQALGVAAPGQTVEMLWQAFEQYGLLPDDDDGGLPQYEWLLRVIANLGANSAVIDRTIAQLALPEPDRKLKQSLWEQEAKEAVSRRHDLLPPGFFEDDDDEDSGASKPWDAEPWVDSPVYPARDESTMPIRREGPKIGRNDPCPCGSGKKYKKCCGK